MRVPKAIALAMSVIVAGIGLVLALQVFNTGRVARELLAEIAAIKPGITDGDEIRRMSSGWRGVVIEDPGCNMQLCSYHFTLTNVWLSRFTLSPESSFSGVVHVVNGKVWSSTIVLSQG